MIPVMDPDYTRFMTTGPAERIVNVLTDQQFLQPHRTVGDAVEAAGAKAGFCPGAGRQAIELLGVNAEKSVGRLQRSELVQLARAIYRLWRQNAAAKQPESQPA
jgi:hypothetical protein